MVNPLPVYQRRIRRNASKYQLAAARRLGCQNQGQAGNSPATSTLERRPSGRQLLSHAYAANVRTYTVVRINRAAITIMAILAETTHYNILSYLKNEPIAKRNTVIPKSKVIAFA